MNKKSAELSSWSWRRASYFLVCARGAGRTRASEVTAGVDLLHGRV